MPLALPLQCDRQGLCTRRAKAGLKFFNGLDGKLQVNSALLGKFGKGWGKFCRVLAAPGAAPYPAALTIRISHGGCGSRCTLGGERRTVLAANATRKAGCGRRQASPRDRSVQIIG